MKLPFWKIIRRQQNQDRVRVQSSLWAIACQGWITRIDRIMDDGERFTAKDNRRRMLNLCELKYEQEN